MCNRDVVFLLLVSFWLCIGLGFFVFNILKLPEHIGINIGAIVYFVIYLIAEKNLPNFKNWSNTKL